MTALERLRGHVHVLRQAVAEGDGERVWGLLDGLEDDLDVAQGEGAALRHVDHCCAVCETTCDEVTAFKRAVCEFQGQGLVLSFALHESRELRDFAREQIDGRFPAERVA